MASVYNLYNRKIKRTCAAILCAVLIITACISHLAAYADSTAGGETVIHVKAGAVGDGKSASSPMGDLYKAIEALSESGGRITVYGRYELASSAGNDGIWGAFVEPSHKGHITISGVDAYLICPENYRYYLSGATTFENIGISGPGALLIAARFNPLCMGDGINIIGFSEGVYLIGGFNGSNSGMKEADLSRDSSVEVRSGKYKYICAYNRGTSSKECTGKADIRISGGQINCVAAGISNNNAMLGNNTMRSLSVTITGGDIFKLCDTDMKSYGTLGSLDLTYEGGSIRHVIFFDTADTSITYTKEAEADAEALLRSFERAGCSGQTPTAQKKIKVACIGDSTTAGSGLSDPDAESYPAILGNMLGDAYEVKNFAEGGRTVLSDSGRAYTDSKSFSESCDYKPDAVLIMLGTNDLAAVSTDEGQKKLYSDILALCERYSSLDSCPAIYLLSPLVRLDDGALDAVIRDVVIPIYKKASEDAGIGFINTHEISEHMTGNFPDSLHPDPAACKYIATYLWGAVTSNKSIGTLYTQGEPHEIIIKHETVVITPPDTDTDDTDDTDNTENTQKDTEPAPADTHRSKDTQNDTAKKEDDSSGAELAAIVAATVVFCAAAAVLILFSRKKSAEDEENSNQDKED